MVQHQPKLYQYALVYHPEPVIDSAGNIKRDKSQIIVPMTQVLAGSLKEITALAARAVPEEYADKLERVEFIIHQLSTTGS